MWQSWLASCLWKVTNKIRKSSEGLTVSVPDSYSLYLINKYSALTADESVGCNQAQKTPLNPVLTQTSCESIAVLHKFRNGYINIQMKSYSQKGGKEHLLQLYGQETFKQCTVFFISFEKLSLWQWNRLSARSHRLCFTGAHDGRGSCRRWSLWDDRPQVSLLLWFIWAGRFPVMKIRLNQQQIAEPVGNHAGHLWVRRHSDGTYSTWLVVATAKQSSLYIHMQFL